ncbi:hypothetical protein [Costertonia aggregata]|uniref:Uncharacterized protein n=1 Tax=Costertonia aggregata TaxID=343403 RepID=A0A7H9ASU3_9FLAO|nr:hypothetical protein [Costertonia aggregata]QLG46510.1 hypothetical protein HYG79_14525 [Costertonia aggregata]
MNIITHMNLKTVPLPLVQDLNYFADADFTPKFFIAILAGVLLALVFQLILTALSVAIGITAIGDVREIYINNRLGFNASKTEEIKDDYEFDQNYSAGTNLGVKITTGFGVWSILTTCISLFAATAIAIRLSLFNYDGIAIALGLVVWAIFFIVLFYLEFKFANTVIGGLINTAMSGLRSSADMVKNAFAPSEQKKLETVISNKISNIRNEFDDAIDTTKINETINSFFERAEKKLPDYSDLVNDLESIANKSKSKNSTGKWMAIQQVLSKAIDNSDKTDKGKQKAAQLKQALKSARQKYAESDTPAQGIAEIMATFSKADKETVEQHLSTIQNYLSTSNDEGLALKSVKTKINELIQNPTAAKAFLQTKIKELDRESIVNYLDKNTNLDRSKIESYADTVEQQLNAARATYHEKTNGNLTKEIENRVRDFFDSTERPEIRYDALRSDFQRIWNDPKQSLSILRSRLDKMDRNTVRALLTNNRYISAENLDKVVDQFEKAKTDTTERMGKIQAEISKRLENVKRKAVIQAEHSRKTAASAAWWLVITALLSGLAAIGGSLVSF